MSFWFFNCKHYSKMVWNHCIFSFAEGHHTVKNVIFTAISVYSWGANKAVADTNQLCKYSLLMPPNTTCFWKPLQDKYNAQRYLRSAFSAYLVLQAAGPCSVTSSLEVKEMVAEKPSTVRRSDNTPTSPSRPFMWLYVRHSWLLVGPGVFTQCWVLTLGTGCSSRADASGAGRLIWAPGRKSEGQTLNSEYQLQPELWGKAWIFEEHENMWSGKGKTISFHFSLISKHIPKMWSGNVQVKSKIHFYIFIFFYWLRSERKWAFKLLLFSKLIYCSLFQFILHLQWKKRDFLSPLLCGL